MSSEHSRVYKFLFHTFGRTTLNDRMFVMLIKILPVLFVLLFCECLRSSVISFNRAVATPVTLE